MEPNYFAASTVDMISYAGKLERKGMFLHKATFEFDWFHRQRHMICRFTPEVKIIRYVTSK